MLGNFTGLGTLTRFIIRTMAVLAFSADTNELAKKLETVDTRVGV